MKETGEEGEEEELSPEIININFVFIWHITFFGSLLAFKIVLFGAFLRCLSAAHWPQIKKLNAGRRVSTLSDRRRRQYHL